MKRPPDLSMMGPPRKHPAHLRAIDVLRNVESFGKTMESLEIREAERLLGEGFAVTVCGVFRPKHQGDVVTTTSLELVRATVKRYRDPHGCKTTEPVAARTEGATESDTPQPTRYRRRDDANPMRGDKLALD